MIDSTATGGAGGQEESVTLLFHEELGAEERGADNTDNTVFGKICFRSA